MNMIKLSEEMYNAYGQSCGWKSFRGDPMPVWENLPSDIQMHWGAAAHRALFILGFDREGRPRAPARLPDHES